MNPILQAVLPKLTADQEVRTASHGSGSHDWECDYGRVHLVVAVQPNVDRDHDNFELMLFAVKDGKRSHQIFFERIYGAKALRTLVETVEWWHARLTAKLAKEQP